MDIAKIAELEKFIRTEGVIEIPLFWNNEAKAVRLNLDQISDSEARMVVIDVLTKLFQSNPFWVCAYGSDSGKELTYNRLISGQQHIHVIPYPYPVDTDWFEYDHNSIACVYTTMESFSIENYVSYVFRYDYFSNSIFLINTSQKIAINVYDRRGIDIVAKDSTMRNAISEKYNEWIEKCR